MLFLSIKESIREHKSAVKTTWRYWYVQHSLRCNGYRSSAGSPDSPELCSWLRGFTPVTDKVRILKKYSQVVMQSLLRRRLSTERMKDSTLQRCWSDLLRVSHWLGMTPVARTAPGSGVSCSEVSWAADGFCLLEILLLVAVLSSRRWAIL